MLIYTLILVPIKVYIYLYFYRYIYISLKIHLLCTYSRPYCVQNAIPPTWRISAASDTVCQGMTKSLSSRSYRWYAVVPTPVTNQPLMYSSFVLYLRSSSPGKFVSPWVVSSVILRVILLAPGWKWAFESPTYTYKISVVCMLFILVVRRTVSTQALLNGQLWTEVGPAFLWPSFQLFVSWKIENRKSKMKHEGFTTVAAFPYSTTTWVGKLMPDFIPLLGNRKVVILGTHHAL